MQTKNYITMKRLLALLFIASTMLISCEQNGVNEPDNPKDAPSVTYKAGTLNPTIGYVGGELAFWFISNCSWVVDEYDDWINISPTDGNQGDHTLAISVAKNSTGEERLSKITIWYGGDSFLVINLTQEANEVFETDSEGNYIVEADGGTVAVKVTTNLEYDVIIPNEALAWISLAGTRAVREETLTLNVAKNDGSEERSATVNLCAKGGDILQTITIKQNKPTPISCANNEIIYTTKDGYPIDLNTTDGFGGNIISHNYANGYGRISFDNDVVSIPNEAFNGCTTLTTIDLPNSLSTIDSSAFYGCTSLTSITIPDSVTSIGDSAFEDCTSQTSVTIGNGVTLIGSEAFRGCTSLTSVTIPDSVTTIGSYAFSGCTSLTSVTIGNGVTSIGNSAFYDCTSLTSVTIPDSVTSIGYYAFQNCTSLTSITIPDSVTEIGEGAFLQCLSLTEFQGKFAADGGRCLIIDRVLKAFAIGCGATEYTIPDSVTTIGRCAFRGCPSLTSVTIPDSVTTIGSYAFSGCTSLTSVTIGNGVTSIEYYAFYDCTSLTSVTIPDSVTEIGICAFRGCTSLTSITIPDSVTKIGDSAFSGCTSLTSVTIPDSVTKIGLSTFDNCDSLTSVTIGNGVTSIGNSAFYDCTSLTSVTIGKSVTTIEHDAFRDCDSLTRVDITDIEAWCKISFGNVYFSNPLYYAHNLYLNGELVTDLVIPDSVTSIEAGAFIGCNKLTSVTIPDSVTKIGGRAFEYCIQKPKTTKTIQK